MAENNNIPEHIKAGRATAEAYLASMFDATSNPPSIFTPETRALYEYAKANVLTEDTVVYDAEGNTHSSLELVMYLYWHAEELADTIAERNPELSNELMATAIMVAMEECRYARFSAWSPYTRMIVNARRAGNRVTRTHAGNLTAQMGNWATNKNKSANMNGNLAACCIYGALKITKGYMFCNRITRNDKGTAEMIQELEAAGGATTHREVIEYHLFNNVIPYLEAIECPDAKAKVTTLAKYLRQTDFYRAPASTRFHCSTKGGLAEHTVNVMNQMFRLTRPISKEDAGAYALAAIAHDFCKIGVYHEKVKNVKIYLKEGENAPDGVQVKKDNGGAFYWGTENGWEYIDDMPYLTHGGKSVFLLTGFIPEVQDEILCAIDAHMGDTNENENVMFQLNETAVALNLHLADIFATNIIEYGKPKLDEMN